MTSTILIFPMHWYCFKLKIIFQWKISIFNSYISRLIYLFLGSFSPFSLHVVSFSRLSLFRKMRKFTFFQGAPTGNTFVVTITSKHHDQFYEYSPRNIDEGGLVNVIIEPLAHLRFKIFKNPSPLIHLSIVEFFNLFFQFLFLFLFLCVIVMHIYFYLVY